VGLPTRLPNITPGRAIRVMQLDKKVRQGRVYFVLPRAVGQVVVEPVATDAILATWRQALVAKDAPRAKLSRTGSAGRGGAR
jgi:3-dehydroquinate synthetase